MPAFAIYRLPYEQSCHLVMQKEGEPEELSSVGMLNSRDGFVVAPFAVDRQHPVLLLQPDVTESFLPERLIDGSVDTQLICKVEEILADCQGRARAKGGSFTHYSIDFANFHAHILEGEFSKIVLARCARQQTKKHKNVLTQFVEACKRYPRMYVALVAAHRCGTWLMATPEVLLRGKEGMWTTMALAGTMTLGDEQKGFDEPPMPGHHSDDKTIMWSVKNIQEQRFVSTYIMECLEQVAGQIEEKGPYTMRAGHLVHLQSDFHFSLVDKCGIGQLLHVLYPTPAVCGLPKRAAIDFILANEFAPREYYSGFVGMLQPEGATDLFVALRCMRIDEDGYLLYAGGGLLADSDLMTEWTETESKMDTMRCLL